jgi:glycosyltransferase involved in cell wall biosynthesis
MMRSVSRETDGNPSEWFPPEHGPVLVMGNAGSVFTRHLASMWRGMGLDARLITRRWPGDRALRDGTPVIVTSDEEHPWARTAFDWIERASWQLESRLVRLQSSRFRKAMGAETSYRPFLSPWLADAIALAQCINRLRPQFVCGQEVFAYGLATAFSRSVPRVLMPWGGDVYMYADTTAIASAAVRYALTHVDLVIPGSPIARDYLNHRFGVPLERMHCGGLWALDRSRFQRANTTGRSEICTRYRIAQDALIVMNVRRFFPAWGSDLAFRAFVAFAREHAGSHFVMLGGGGTEPFVSDARAVLAREGLSSRFTLLDGDRPLEECAALMSVSDICVSLMRERDMRPFASILEAVSCGAVPILSDQVEYRLMEGQGFRALFCGPGDETAVITALRRYAADEPVRRETRDRNEYYLEQHENGHEQAIDLLRRVRQVCDAHPVNNGDARGA